MIHVLRLVTTTATLLTATTTIGHPTTSATSPETTTTTAVLVAPSGSAVELDSDVGRPHVLDNPVGEAILRVRGSALCSGTPLTGTRFVVTAAHCVLDDDGAIAGHTTVVRYGAEYTPLRAVLLATGGFVAIGAGQPDVPRRWEREALDLAHDNGGAPYAVALAGCLRAAPLILTEPEEARHHLLDAAAAAAELDDLTSGLVQMWINMAALCQPTLDLPTAPHADPDAFGGPGTVPWSTARELGALVLAEHGDYDAAVALLTSDDQDVHAGLPIQNLYRQGVEAFAGDPNTAFRNGVALVQDVRRFSDAILRGELAALVGISLLRLGHFGRALQHFESAKRAPMTFPFWYALARRYGRQARDQIGAEQAADILAIARSRSADDVLADDLSGMSP